MFSTNASLQNHESDAAAAAACYLVQNTMLASLPTEVRPISTMWFILQLAVVLFRLLLLT